MTAANRSYPANSHLAKAIDLMTQALDELLEHQREKKVGTPDLAPLMERIGILLALAGSDAKGK